MTSYFFSDDEGNGFIKKEDDPMGDGSGTKPLKVLISEAENDKDGKSSVYVNKGTNYRIWKVIDSESQPVLLQCSEGNHCAFRRTLIKQPDTIGPITALLVSKYPKNGNEASVQYNRSSSLDQRY